MLNVDWLQKDRAIDPHYKLLSYNSNKLHGQTRDRAKDQTSGVMSLCAIEDKTAVVVVASYCSVSRNLVRFKALELPL